MPRDATLGGEVADLSQVVCGVDDEGARHADLWFRVRVRVRHADVWEACPEAAGSVRTESILSSSRKET